MAFTEVTETLEVQAPPEGTAYGFTAGEDIIAGQVVKIGGDESVQPSDTDGEEVIGVATQTVSSGDTVYVAGSGARVKFTSGSGGVSAGDKLTSHGATGEEGQVDTASATGDFIVGHALEADGGSQGNTFLGVVDLGGEVN